MADDDFIIESHGEAPGSRHGISGPVEFIIEEIPVYEMDSDEDPESYEYAVWVRHAIYPSLNAARHALGLKRQVR